VSAEPAAAPSPPGERFGNYILTAHLGRGGMADVFRAQRTGVAGFARTVVVKRILSQYTSDPAFVSMFVNEAKIAAQLHHPNIAQVFDLGEQNGEYFMCLEYVRGTDLLGILRRLAKEGVSDRAIPPAAAAYIARELCRGLAHAHAHVGPDGQQQPIIHRDVSPQNVMVSWDGQVKLVDFGIAKAMFSMREETRTGALKGKIAYMSPEQVTGDHPGPESDVFAVGVVLYEMLIGRRLFKGQNDFETINRVKSMQIPPPSRVASWVPRDLDEVVMKALERERSARYPLATLMARDLDAFLASERFSIEQMAEWMDSAWPPDERKEIPDGQLALPESSGSASSSSAGSSPSASAHGGTRPGTPRSLAADPARQGNKTALIVAGLIAAVALGVLGTVLVLRRPHLPTVSAKTATDVPQPPPQQPPPPPQNTVVAPPKPPEPVVAKDADKHKKDRHKHGAKKIEAFDDEDSSPKKKPAIETFDD
jgi:serine/threonine-protein kinase